MWKSEEYLTDWGSDWAKKVGEQIKEDRTNAGYSIRRLAERIDVSPTHLSRMETGDRPLDSTKTLVRLCEACHVPIERYLVLYGMRISEKDSPIRRAFPSIETPAQEDAVNKFVNLLTSNDLTPEDITQILNAATAFSEFCTKNKTQKKAEASSQE